MVVPGWGDRGWWLCLREWQEAGGVEWLHEVLLAELDAAGQIEWS
ncbi:hypothetical protein SAMN04487905_114112, partial [Actinopolyspora xinjiangensis]